MSSRPCASWPCSATSFHGRKLLHQSEGWALGFDFDFDWDSDDSGFAWEGLDAALGSLIPQLSNLKEFVNHGLLYQKHLSQITGLSGPKTLRLQRHAFGRVVGSALRGKGTPRFLMRFWTGALSQTRIPVRNTGLDFQTCMNA